MGRPLKQWAQVKKYEKKPMVPIFEKQSSSMLFASHAIFQLKQRDESEKNLRAWRHCFNRFYERQFNIPFDSKVRLKSEVHSWAKTSCPPSKPVSRADTMLLRQMSALACTVFTLEKETGSFAGKYWRISVLGIKCPRFVKWYTGFWLSEWKQMGCAATDISVLHLQNSLPF